MPSRVQRFELGRSRFKQAQQIDIVNVGHRDPRGVSMQTRQTRRDWAAEVPGDQFADRSLTRHLLTGLNGRPDRLIAGAQTVGVRPRHRRAASCPANTMVARPWRVYRLARNDG